MIARRPSGPAQQGDETIEQRAYVRWPFKGTSFPCRMGKKTFEIRLKDLSRGGACGLVDEPFAVGDHFFLELDAHNVVEAQVAWVRLVTVGVRFNRVLTASFVTRLHERDAHDAAERERAALEALRSSSRR